MKKASLVAAMIAFALSAAFAQRIARIGKPGFVGLANDRGVWSFVTPEGKPFFSRGVDVVRERDDSTKPGERGYDGLSGGRTRDAWAADSARLMRSWNFDTVGCWSSDSMRGRGLYTVDILYVRIERNGRIVDVFDPAFEGEAEAVAAKVCAPRRDDKELLGYFLENEQPWYGDFGWYTGHASTLLDAYMAMPAKSAGKKALLAYYRKAYSGIGALNAAYGSSYASWEEFSKAAAFPYPSKALNADREAFVGEVANRYYSVVTGAARSHDPNHLVLGDRFANGAPREAIRACGRYCDAVSLNYYLGFKAISPEYLRGFSEVSGKPLLITEFSYRVMENRSGNPNSKGADVTVKTQADRAAGYARYTRSLAGIPFVIGYHWFQFSDEPTGGRSFDGEDSDYGVVDIDGRPYEELTAAMREANAAVPALHAASASLAIGASVFLDEPVKVNRGTAIPSRNAAPLPLLGSASRSFGWTDAANSAKISLATRSASILADYDTGSGAGWGCGFTLLLDSGQGETCVDLGAYQGIELRLSGPAGLRFFVFVTEAGAADVSAAEFRGIRGSDGESFSSSPLLLKDGNYSIRIPFDLLAPRASYGNQKGNRTIDLSAIHDVEIYLPGGQGAGRLALDRCVAY